MSVEVVNWVLVAIVTVFGLVFVAASLLTLRDYFRWRRAVIAWAADLENDGPPPPWPR